MPDIKPTPDIKPDRNLPGFTPAKSPEVNPKPGSEFERGTASPEILPDSSPDATPPSPPTEIPVVDYP